MFSDKIKLTVKAQTIDRLKSFVYKIHIFNDEEWSDFTTVRLVSAGNESKSTGLKERASNLNGSTLLHFRYKKDLANQLHFQLILYNLFIYKRFINS